MGIGMAPDHIAVPNPKGPARRTESPALHLHTENGQVPRRKTRTSLEDSLLFPELRHIPIQICAGNVAPHSPGVIITATFYTCPESALPGDRTTSQSQGPPDCCPGATTALEAEPWGSIGGQRDRITMGRRGWTRNVEGHSLLQTHRWPQSRGQNWLRQVGKLPVRQPCASTQTVFYTESTSPPNESPLSVSCPPSLPDPTPGKAYVCTILLLPQGHDSVSLLDLLASNPPSQEPGPFSASANGTTAFQLGVGMGNQHRSQPELGWGSRGLEGP